MPLLPRLTSLWGNLVHKTQNEQELTEELNSYLELLIEQKRETGLSLEEQVKEQVREVRMGYWLETLRQDLHYAVRMLRKNPGFALIAILTLALGIGVNTALFSVVDAVMLKLLPVRQPEQLVLVRWFGGKGMYQGFRGSTHRD